jgi:hypothetical protein
LLSCRGLFGFGVQDNITGLEIKKGALAIAGKM